MAAIRRPLRKKEGATTSTSRRPVTGKKLKSPAGRKSMAGAGTASGADGFARASAQQERQQEDFERRKEKPFAFRITAEQIKKKENVVDLLYLDKDPFFARLHTVPNPSGGFDDEVCLADTGEPCFLCQRLGKEGTWTLILTALDKRPYRTREGVLVKQSKRLVMVKSRNIDKFERQFTKRKSFRGMVVTHRRTGAKEASIGEDLEFKTKTVPEAMIAKSGPELSTVTDYSKVFAALTPEQMESKYAGVSAGNSYGGARGAGTRAATSSSDDDSPVW